MAQSYCGLGPDHDYAIFRPRHHFRENIPTERMILPHAQKSPKRAARKDGAQARSLGGDRANKRA